MAELELKKIKVLNELTAVADEDLLAVVDDPTGVSETKAITRGNLLGSTIISTDLGMASKTAGAALPIQKNSIIASDLQLTGSTADGFAATPTAIYNMDATGADAPDAAYTGTKVGAYDLTVKAESLASGADALGNAKYCQFAGSGYLQSTNAVFDFSGTFAVGFKMFFPDWTPTSAATIISNADAANAGCRLDLSKAGVLTWYEDGVAICSVNVSRFDATKFYGVEIWRDAANVYILIDGVIVASGARGTITQKAVFQISGYNGATQLMPAGSRVDEVFVDFVNTHTADTLRNIYARSAKKFAVKSQDGGVVVDNEYSKNIDVINEKTNGDGVRFLSNISIARKNREGFGLGRTPRYSVAGSGSVNIPLNQILPLGLNRDRYCALLIVNSNRVGDANYSTCSLVLASRVGNYVAATAVASISPRSGGNTFTVSADTSNNLVITDTSGNASTIDVAGMNFQWQV